MWNDRFATNAYVFGTEPAQFLIQHKDLLVPGKKALSVADGEGRNGVYLAQSGLDVVSMDSSSNAQQKAAKLAAERGVTLELALADIMDWPWEEGAFDLAVGIFIQFLAPEARESVFEGMKRTVRPGGLVLLHGYTPKQIEYGTGGPRAVENLYTEDMLRAAFAGFDLLELRAYEAVIDEGEGHSGRSALIDLVARRPE